MIRAFEIIYTGKNKGTKRVVEINTETGDYIEYQVVTDPNEENYGQVYFERKCNIAILGWYSADWFIERTLENMRGVEEVVPLRSAEIGG